MTSEIEQKRIDGAASWSAALLGQSAQTSPDHKRWLAENAGNVAAWTDAKRALGTFDDLAGSSPEVLSILHEARGDARRHIHQAKMRARRTTMAWAASLALTMVLAGTGAWWLNRPTVYQTGQGERRTVALEDGSRLALDSATRVVVRYGRSSRKLDLIGGQARFDVAHDAARPFSVHAGDRTVVATGTRFDIDVLGPKVVVTLLQGHVVVLDDHPVSPATPTAQTQARRPQGAVNLEPGHRLIATAGTVQAPSIVQEVDVTKADAWQTGEIVFEGEALGAAAARISRYTDRPVVVRDSRLASVKVTGIFRAGDLPAFLDAVTTIFPVKAISDTDGTIELTPLPKRSG